MTVMNDGSGPKDRVILPNRLHDGNLLRLKEALLGHRHKPLEIDASAVCHIGALGVQFLISLRRQWHADGAALRIHGVGDPVLSVCARLGIPASALGVNSGQGGV